MRKIYLNISGQLVVYADDDVTIEEIQENISVDLNEAGLRHRAELSSLSNIDLAVTDSK